MERTHARRTHLLALLSGLALLVPAAAPAPLVLEGELSAADGLEAPSPEVVRVELVDAEVAGAGEAPQLRVRVRPLTEAGASPPEVDPAGIELLEDGRPLAAELGAEAEGVLWLQAEVTADGAEHEIAVRIGQGSAHTRLAYPAPAGSAPAGLGLGVALAVGLPALVTAGLFAWRWRRQRGAPSLTLLSGPESGRVFRVGPGIFRIGAMEGNDIVLASPGVSRFHAEILRGPSGHEIRDLHSSNGTLVNGERVQVAALRPGDKIQVADVELFFGG